MSPFYLPQGSPFPRLTRGCFQPSSASVPSPAGVDVVHGHSSHHAKGAEVYRGRLLLYGCGDLISVRESAWRNLPCVSSGTAKH